MINDAHSGQRADNWHSSRWAPPMWSC